MEMVKKNIGSFGYITCDNPFSMEMDLRGKTVPKSFFKYYAVTENSVDALEKLYVYASHPNQLNDPFDCDENIVKFNTWEDVNQIYKLVNVDAKREFLSLESACDRLKTEYRILLYRELGILSLTDNWNKRLLWTHYTGNRGVCVEFDVERFPFRKYGPFPINYQDDFQCQNISEGRAMAMLVQTTVKNMEWKYEDEWRLLIPKPDGFSMMSFGDAAEMYNLPGDYDRKFKYPLSAIKSITLGLNFMNTNHLVLNGGVLEIVENERSLCGRLLNLFDILRIAISKGGAFVPIYKLYYDDKSYELKRAKIQIMKISKNRFRIIGIS